MAENARINRMKLQAQEAFANKDFQAQILEVKTEEDARRLFAGFAHLSLEELTMFENALSDEDFDRELTDEELDMVSGGADTNMCEDCKLGKFLCKKYCPGKKKK